MDIYTFLYVHVKYFPVWNRKLEISHHKLMLLMLISFHQTIFFIILFDLFHSSVIGW